MAIVFGTAGGHARRRALFGRFALPLWVILDAILLWIGYRWSAIWHGVPRVLAMLAILLELAYIAWHHRELLKEIFDDWRSHSAWAQGADGERRVGVHLDHLPGDYVVFHDFRPVDSEGEPMPWNVDHIVVGPTGVFVIETKMYSAARVPSAATNKYTRRGIQQVRGNAMELKDRLRRWSSGALDQVFVEAVLVYAQDNAFVETLKEGSTRVIPLQYLSQTILGRSKNDLTGERALRIARCLALAMGEPNQSRLQPLAALGEAHTAAWHSRDEEPVLGHVNLCPKCGAPLKRRTATHGKWAGRDFLGCSRWDDTRCDYILNIEEAAT